MLRQALPEIKGKLLHYFFEMYSGMNSYEENGKTKIDYEEFFAESIQCVKEITEITSISDLDRFCEEWGLNDLDNELAFHNLANEYLKPKYESRQQGTIQEGVQTTT